MKPLIPRKRGDIMNFTIIDLTDVSKEQLQQAIDTNNKTEIRLKTEIKKLQQASLTKRKKKTYEEKISHPLPPHQEENPQITLEDEMSFYINNMRGKDPKEISNVIPSTKNKHYQAIMLRLKLETMRALREIKELIAITPNISKEELTYYQEELKKENQRLKTLNHIINEKVANNQQTIKEEQQKNTLVLVPTVYGNCRVLEDMDKIPKDYYESFKELFESIENNTFKNIKRFVASNDATAGFCEVKDFKTRVVFDRIGPTTYAVITAFMKKSDNDKAYLEPLKRKLSEYKKVKPMIAASLENEDFMRENNQNVLELWNKLGKEQENSIVKEKGGEKHD